MTPSAWAFMIVVWSIIVGMTVYCFARLVSSKQFTDPDLDANHTSPFKPPENGD